MDTNLFYLLQESPAGTNSSLSLTFYDYIPLTLAICCRI